MQRPVEIAFHNIQSSPSLEAEIRERVARLDTLYDGLIACRVSVEALHRQHQTGNLFEVHVVMSVPGRDLAVSREPHKAKERFANPDVRVSLREAFRAAERQLLEHKRSSRGQVKPHGEAFHGEVTRIDRERDHGFILTSAGAQLYFHRHSLAGDGFDRLRPGDPVHFVEADGDTGPTAKRVWLAAEEPMD